MNELGNEPGRTQSAEMLRREGGNKPNRSRISTKNLSLGFGKKIVVKDVNINFEMNSISAIVGPTGCGKSTFIRSLNRLNDEVKGFWHQGEVFLDGISIYSKNVDPLKVRRMVGMLFQRPNPFPMSIRDNVLVGVKTLRLRPRKEFDEIVEMRLTEVGLFEAVKDRLNDSPFRLSGGQQQLLCLARALSIGPEVLLLDEPTSSLDPLSTQAVEKLLMRLVPGLTVIIVTHNLAQARRIANRAAFFCDGELIEQGPAAVVLEEPQHLLTKQFVTGEIG